MPDQPTKSNPPEPHLFFKRYDRVANTEHVAVTKILRWAGVKKSTMTTFADLESAGFPIRLVVVNSNKRFGSLLRELMLHPATSELFGMFDRARAALSADYAGNLAIVFSWRNSLWTFHDCELVGTLGESGFYTHIHGQCFFFEKLQSLVARFGPATDW